MAKYDRKNHPKEIHFDAERWGPPYWFFLHTVAYTYPEIPTEVTKRKYYDLIHNMPLFLPDAQMGDRFNEFLHRYPVTPYLDSRESFMRWVHFIHNKFNVLLGKEEISMYEALDRYYQELLPTPVVQYQSHLERRDLIYLAILFVLCLVIYLYAT